MLIASLGVVLDACVLFSAPIRDTLLRAAEHDLFRIQWTNEILEEVRRNLVGTGRSNEQKAQRLINAMKAAFPEANITGYERLVSTMTNNPKDRHVLAAAVVSKSHLIITDNLRHFSEESLAPFNIQAQSPDVFLTSLFEHTPEIMTQIVLEQASNLRRPPITVHRVLEALSRNAPQFAGLVEFRVGSDDN